MNVKVEKDKNIVTLEIEVDKETFEAGMEKAYRKNVKSIAIPGFRKRIRKYPFLQKSRLKRKESGIAGKRRISKPCGEPFLF